MKPCKKCKFAALCLSRKGLGAGFVFGRPGDDMTTVDVKQPDGGMKQVPVTKQYKAFINTRPRDCPEIKR